MRLLNVLLGVVVVVMGLVPLLKNSASLPSFLDFVPREGVIYYVVIIVAGLIVIISSSREKRSRFRFR